MRRLKVCTDVRTERHVTNIQGSMIVNILFGLSFDEERYRKTLEVRVISLKSI